MAFLDDIRAHADAQKAAEMARYHKAERAYLGVSNRILDDLAKRGRRELSVPERVDTARDLWATDIHEARIAAAKLLTQARIPEDDAVWALIASWVPEFDAWAVADAASAAGERRLMADPARLDEVEAWTTRPHMWSRRAALVMTLPWSRLAHPKPAEQAARERILGWAAGYVTDRDWFIQKSVSWWLRTLSRKDPDAVRSFMQAHGATMKPFARKDAMRLIEDP